MKIAIVMALLLKSTNLKNYSLAINLSNDKANCRCHLGCIYTFDLSAFFSLIASSSPVKTHHSDFAHRCIFIGHGKFINFKNRNSKTHFVFGRENASSIST